MNRSSITMAGTLIALAGNLAAQTTVVVGIGDPKVDVPAVRAAVHQGGRVTLKGRFSFDAPPTVPEQPTGTAIVGAFGMVLVSKAVTISGTLDDQNERTSIEGGTNPFYVDAPGAHVAIQGLHFVRSKIFAIRVVAAVGLVIASNRIEGLVVDTGTAMAIDVNTSAGPPDE